MKDFYECIDDQRGYRVASVSDDQAHNEAFRAWLDGQRISYEVTADEDDAQLLDIETGWIELAAQAVLLKISWGGDGIRLSEWQKHERQSIEAIKKVAKQHGVETEVITRGKHPTKVQLSGPRGNAMVGISSSPRDETHAIRVAQKEARERCRKICSAEFADAI